MFLETIFEKAGPIGFIILGLGFLSLYLFLRHKIYLWLAWREFSKNNLDLNLISSTTNHTNNPFLKLLRELFFTHMHHSDDLKTEVAYLFSKIFHKTLQGTSLLRLIAQVSPLLGLMGTVVGMVKVFKVISQSSFVDIHLFAHGIWEALFTTILGLLVAIPTLAFYHFLRLKLERLYLELVEVSFRLKQSYLEEGSSTVNEKAKVLNL